MILRVKSSYNMPNVPAGHKQIWFNTGKPRLLFKRKGSGWAWVRGNRAYDELWKLRNAPVAYPKNLNPDQTELLQWWEEYRKTMKQPNEEDSEPDNDEKMGDQILSDESEDNFVESVTLQKGKKKVVVSITMENGQPKLEKSGTVSSWDKVKELTANGYKFTETEENVGMIEAIQSILVDGPPVAAPNKKKRKRTQAVEEEVMNKHWAGNLDEDEMEGIRNSKLPGEYKEVKQSMDNVSSTERESNSSIEGRKNQALAKMLKEEQKGSGEDAIFSDKSKWVTYNYDKKVTKDRGLRNYNEAFKEWITLAAKVAEDPKQHYAKLLKSINKNINIIDIELRRYYRDYKSVNRATSPSLIAALQVALNGVKTYSVFDLIDQFIEVVTADMEANEVKAFLKLFSNGGEDMLLHIRLFNISSEFQLRNHLKIKTLKRLEAKLVPTMNKKEIEELYDPITNVALERHQALVTITKQKLRQEQNNPTSFMASDLFAFANDLIASTNVHDKILLVQLCTGARWIEVVKVSQFYLTHQTNWKNANKNPISTYHGHDPQRDIVVVGVAKVRRNKVSNQSSEEKKGDEKDADEEEDSEGDNQDVSDDSKELTVTDAKRVLAPKPVMFVKPEEIQHMVYNLIRPWFKSKMRGQDPTYDGATNHDLTTSYNKLTNARLRTYSITSRPEDMKRVHTHTMRKLYANYSYDTYAAKSITKPAWIQMVLGHLPTSFMSSLAYNTANVFDAVPQTEHPKEEFRFGELQAALKNARKLLQVSNADHLRSLFITRDHEVVKLELVSRGGYSHEERLAVFRERTEQMRQANIPQTSQNYRQLGFSHKYVKAQLQIKK
jgi:hypothetical protein